MSKPADRGRKIAAPPDTAAIAVSLARIGWPVFPVSIYEDASGKRHKVPAVKWKAEASTDPELVAKWFAGKHAGRWVGVYCEPAGIVVGDVDPGGDDEIAARGLDLPKTFNYPTHRAGGRHHVYAAPEGIELTIARGVIVDGEALAHVDVRSGAGLFVYYGPELAKPPKLAPAPDWLLVTRDRPAGAEGSNDRAPSADESEYRARLRGGDPDAAVRAVLAHVKSDGMTHDDMLEAVTALVKLGTLGAAGVGDALDAARETYAAGWPDAGRHWDNAVTGSVRRLGLPPVTLALSKAERKALVKRNKPDEIEKVDEERKRVYKVKKHKAAIERSRDDDAKPIMPGDRVLEDGPLAEELARALRDRWAYAPGYGIMRYASTKRAGRWKSAEEHSLIEAVRRLLTDVEIDEHTAAAMRGDNKAIDKARSLLSRGRAQAVARLVVGILAEREITFDAHPDLLNTPTGVVDLRTGKLSKARPDYYFTKITKAPYDPKADDRLWRKALGALPKATADWLKVRLGQAATGYTPSDDELLILEGSGENGKTTVLHGAKAALGEYAVTVSSKLLVGNPNDHPTTLMTLRGARMAVVEELPEGRNLNVKQLKDAVGTPEITARKMRQDEETFRTTHTLCISTNYLPIVAETDHGTWRRLLLVRFPYKFLKSDEEATGSKRERRGDRRLKHAFDAGDAGALRWLVEGAVEWYALGMQDPRPPKRVTVETQAWRMDADPILAYVGERLVRDDGYAIPTADLAADFNHWLERRGHKAWSSQTINSRFGGHVTMDGVERKTVKWSAAVRPSRPPLGMATIPKVTTSWRGVRFADDGQRMPSEAELDAAAIADLERRATS